MESARKILVLVTPKYLNALNAKESSSGSNDDENVFKVNAEFNYMSSIVHSSLQNTSKILVVCRGVGREQLPSIFSATSLCQFGGGKNREEQMRNIVRHLTNT